MVAGRVEPPSRIARIVLDARRLQAEGVGTININGVDIEIISFESKKLATDRVSKITLKLNAEVIFNDYTEEIPEVDSDIPIVRTIADEPEPERELSFIEELKRL